MASRKKKPEIVTLSEAEMEGLLHRLETDALNASDKTILAGSLKSNLWLKRQYESSKISLRKLATLLFGPRTEKNKPSSSACASSASTSASPQEQAKEEKK